MQLKQKQTRKERRIKTRRKLVSIKYIINMMKKLPTRVSFLLIFKLFIPIINELKSVRITR